MYKKARRGEARLGYLGQVLMEHRSGVIVDARVTPADGHGERDAAVLMIEARPGAHRITVAADKAYDTRDFIANLRPMRATPHVAQYATTPHRRSALDGRTTAKAEASGRPPGDVDLYLHSGRLQHRPPPATAAGDGMTVARSPSSTRARLNPAGTDTPEAGSPKPVAAGRWVTSSAAC